MRELREAERRRAHKQAEEAYRKLVEESLQRLTILQDSKFVFVNSATAAIAHYSVEELLSLPDPIGSLVHPETRSDVAQRAGNDWDSALGALADEPAVIPAIVYAELLVGVLLADSQARAANRRTRVEALVAYCPVVEFAREIAERWAQLFALLSREGNMIPASDLAIAATALYLDFGVLVGPKDEGHYRKIPGLRCVRLPL